MNSRRLIFHVDKFQFLIGRLKTFFSEWRRLFYQTFQFLIGRLKTPYATLKVEIPWGSFNSS